MIGACSLFYLLLPLSTGCFREKTQSSNIAIDDELKQLYNQFEEHMLEKDEVLRSKDAPILRVFIAPTFSNPYFVSVQKSGTAYFAVAKKMLGKGGYHWGGELLRLTKKVPLKIGESVWDIVRNDEIWKPFSEYELAVMSGATEGETWIIEFYDGARLQRMMFRDPRTLLDHNVDKRLRDPSPYLHIKDIILDIAKVNLEQVEVLE